MSCLFQQIKQIILCEGGEPHSVTVLTQTMSVKAQGSWGYTWLWVHLETPTSSFWNIQIN